ncbi:MAG TPA: Mur ligase family protein [Candidatus Saccharibacteria bacterium]|jgi:UDP-N-acetylmuramoyl-tripeptide--D-alanyl-D-alanine ligase|nr:Mur ligase family protein [Candidatus Saccharibacteria bacterium]
MLNRFLSFYSASYEKAIVYMLQRSEYQIGKFSFWYWKFPNFRQVSYRGELKKTVVAKIILLILIILRILLNLLGLFLVLKNLLFPVGPILILLAPLIEYILLLPTVSMLRFFYIKPKMFRMNRRAEDIFKKTSAIKIAVLGSYGKTTVKELLAQVLASKYKVAFTPGNMNTQIAHARFALSLKGDEDFIIIEYGEEHPSDIAKMATVTHPDYAIITGMAPAHLDAMKNLDVVADELGSILNFVDAEKVFWNAGSEQLKKHLDARLKFANSYSDQLVLGQKISRIDASSINGISFKLGSTKLNSKILGQHMAGSLGLISVLAKKFKLSDADIAAAIAQTKAFEARMQPISLGGATMINDGYNGNIEGIEAGIETLTKLKVGGRKIYATPGLIAQGEQNTAVHKKIGQLLAESNFDRIYLFKNSNTEIIFNTMLQLNPNSKPEFIEDPLKFLKNIQSFLANGDVILVQNDLPDGA